MMPASPFWKILELWNMINYVKLVNMAFCLQIYKPEEIQVRVSRLSSHDLDEQFCRNHALNKGCAEKLRAYLHLQYKG